MEKLSKKEIYDKIENGIINLLESDRFKEYLSFAARMRRYSFFNTLMIFSVMPEATHVAGMRKWNELGRKVIKEQKALKILAPTFRTETKVVTDENTGEEKEETRQYLTGYILVPVFDVSQTEGKEIPSPVSNFGSDTELLEAVKDIYSCKYSIKEMELRSNLGGYTDGTEIVLNSGRSEEQRLKTLIHEVAHCELRHVGDIEKERKIQEIEAEMTAYIVSDYFGIDSSDYSFGYLASWSKGNVAAVRTSMDTAFKTAQDIIGTIERAFAAEGLQEAM
jgi:hypothetical protein